VYENPQLLYCSFSMVQLSISKSEAKKTEATNALKMTPHAEYTN